MALRDAFVKFYQSDFAGGGLPVAAMPKIEQSIQRRQSFWGLRTIHTEATLGIFVHPKKFDFDLRMAVSSFMLCRLK